MNKKVMEQDLAQIHSSESNDFGTAKQSALTLSALSVQPGQELETTNLIEKSARFRHEIFV